MGKFITASPRGKASIVLSDEPLGKGGEGSVYAVKSHDATFLSEADNLVAKIYHEGHGDKNKVKAMLLSPPESDSVAWPLSAIFTEQGTFKGFVMKKIDFSSNRPWSELSHSGERKKTAQDFDVLYALTAVRNFAVALDDVHAAGHHVGDINESNMFVGSDAQVVLVDTDSAEVNYPKTNSVFPCMVGKPEYTAAEISHGKLKDQKRSVATDTFGFAVAAYQMILGGPHPADALYSGKGEPPSVVEKIRQENFPALQSNRAHRGFAPPPRVAISGMPEQIKEILLRALSLTPEMRPSLEEIINRLDDVCDHITQCDHVPQHWFDSRDKKCGWCAHAEKTGVDPWNVAPAVDKNGADKRNGTSQRSLSAVNFGSGAPAAQAKAPRMPPQQRTSQHSGLNSGLAGVNQQHSQGYPQAQQAQYGVQQGYPQGYPQGHQRGYPQGHLQGYPQQQAPNNNLSQNPPTQEELQKHFNTKKTVLSLQSGGYRVRPPLGELLRSRPRLAFSCMISETPSFMAFWWSNRQVVPVWWALLVGFALSGGMALLWWMMMYDWLVDLYVYIAGSFWPPLHYLFMANTIIATVGVSFASLWMTFSGLLHNRRYKKKYGSLKNVTKENVVKTVLRYVSISIIWGPVLMVGTVVGTVLALCNMIINGISRAESTSMMRR